MPNTNELAISKSVNCASCHKTHLYNLVALLKPITITAEVDDKGVPKTPRAVVTDTVACSLICPKTGEPIVVDVTVEHSNDSKVVGIHG